MRSKSKSEFEKDFYKLMVNAVFGKAQENLRNRINVEVVTNRARALKLVSKPSCKRSLDVREDLTVIQNSITNICLNKPLYVAFSVLDLSKLHMYKFHYENMRQRYSNINLCFTDTDSLLYEVETDDIFDDMIDDSDNYDLSDYEPSHHCFKGMSEKDVMRFQQQNKKAIGKFKDELKGLTLKELIGLRPKCYSLLYLLSNLTEDEKQTAKGVKKTVKRLFLSTLYIKKHWSIIPLLLCRKIQ